MAISGKGKGIVMTGDNPGSDGVIYASEFDGRPIDPSSSPFRIYYSILDGGGGITFDKFTPVKFDLHPALPNHATEVVVDIEALENQR